MEAPLACLRAHSLAANKERFGGGTSQISIVKTQPSEHMDHPLNCSCLEYCRSRERTHGEWADIKYFHYAMGKEFDDEDFNACYCLASSIATSGYLEDTTKQLGQNGYRQGGSRGPGLWNETTRASRVSESRCSKPCHKPNGKDYGLCGDGKIGTRTYAVYQDECVDKHNRGYCGYHNRWACNPWLQGYKTFIHHDCPRFCWHMWQELPQWAPSKNVC